MREGDLAEEERITRLVFHALLTAEARVGINETAAMIWMEMSQTPGPCSVAGLAEAVGRDRKTVRDRLNKLKEQGIVYRAKDGWRLTDMGRAERRERFLAVWRELPEYVRGIVRREADRARGAMPP